MAPMASHRFSFCDKKVWQDESKPIWLTAAATGDVEKLKELWRSGKIKDVNVTGVYSVRRKKFHQPASISKVHYDPSEKSATALQAAVMNGRLNAIRWFLSLPGINYASALHDAVRTGNPSVLAAFLDTNVPLNVIADNDFNLLHTAVRTGNSAIVAMLLATGQFDLDAKCSVREDAKAPHLHDTIHKRTALELASKDSHAWSLLRHALYLQATAPDKFCDFFKSFDKDEAGMNSSMVTIASLKKFVSGGLAIPKAAVALVRDTRVETRAPEVSVSHLLRQMSNALVNEQRRQYFADPQKRLCNEIRRLRSILSSMGDLLACNEFFKFASRFAADDMRIAALLKLFDLGPEGSPYRVAEADLVKSQVALIRPYVDICRRVSARLVDPEVIAAAPTDSCDPETIVLKLNEDVERGSKFLADVEPVSLSMTVAVGPKGPSALEKKLCADL